MATAQVLFQRFYYSKSLVKHDCEVSYSTFNVQAIGRLLFLDCIQFFFT